MMLAVNNDNDNVDDNDNDNDDVDDNDDDDDNENDDDNDDRRLSSRQSEAPRDLTLGPGTIFFAESHATLHSPCAGSLTILTSAPTGVELRFEMTR